MKIDSTIWLAPLVPCFAVTIAGCGTICESFASYSIYGSVVDSDSGLPITSGTASVVLYRGSRVIVPSDVLQNEVIDENGEFDVGIFVDVNGGTCGDPYFPPPPLASLGEPPDEAVVFVRSENRAGIASIAISPEQIAIEDEQTGIIELGTVEVTMIDMKMMN